MADEIEILNPPGANACLTRLAFTVSGRYRTDANFIPPKNVKPFRIQVTLSTTTANLDTKYVDYDGTGTAWQPWAVPFTNLAATTGVTVKVELILKSNSSVLDDATVSPGSLSDSCAVPDEAVAQEEGGKATRTAKKSSTPPPSPPPPPPPVRILHRTVTASYGVGEERNFHRVVAIVEDPNGVVWSVVEGTFRGGRMAAVIPIPENPTTYRWYFILLDPSNRVKEIVYPKKPVMP